ncbi:DUF2844 domain-containing protein [Caballeronia ptereochthonis]|uniref:DUF2844 domain-containing protein n=1 Tax=Caballeronia ptereochthonis TaxID=1777144 RepID=A0A158CQC5_9BURK|nr:DUF2844 domain-containing protein [Caballeronia ptereochthonis]SAK84545.1 hypothetical protein AWB83_04581 [Caballeronia ptereochthonis]
MKAPKQSRHGHLAKALAFAASALSVCAAAPAYAVLGGEPMNAPQGATATSAKAVAHAATASGASSTSASDYTIRSTTLASGTVINEYLSAQGTVFGIAWKGPRVPDLASLLGSYFPQYQQGLKAQRAARGGRGPVSVQDSGLVVESDGHMGAFAGRAYLPQSLPAGVSASDIQ